MQRDVNITAKNIVTCFDSVGREYPDNDLHWGNDIPWLFGELDKHSSLYPIRILYPGCGPGRLFTTLSGFSEKIYSVLAMDMSSVMTKEATAALFRIASFSRLGVSVVQQNFMTDILEDEEGGEFDLVLCLNNTLGNIIDGDYKGARMLREDALRRFGQRLRYGGFLFLTVYNRDLLPREENSLYSPFLKINTDESDFSSGDLSMVFSREGVPDIQFYSHWFTEPELKGLLKSQGFSTRADEGYVVAKCGPRFLCLGRYLA